MAFNIGSIANNALQLQLQQMLGNFVNAQPQVALAPQHTTANQMPIPTAGTANQLHLAAMAVMNNNNTQGAANANSKDVPMELETPNEGIIDGMGRRTTSESELGDKSMSKPLGMLSNGEIIYGNMMGLPGTLVPGTSQFPLMMSAGMVDPNLLNMQQQLSMVQQMNRIAAPVTAPNSTPEPGTSGQSGQTKELIQCKSCTLFPPNPNAPKPTTREKPAGCRTVFVGGLPENMTEQVIHEIFERCGEITTLRLSKKNFCHIRFVFEASVESAIYLSGYRVRMGNSNDVANCGRLHVDYAQARDDQYEYECRTRQQQREQRHREKMEKERLRPLSPPQIIHYSESEAMNLGEKIKSDDKFLKACQVLCTWLERGDCNKKNSNIFYTIIQSTNSHVRRLQNEKATYEQEFKEAKDKYKKQMMTITVQFNQIDKVFTAANHKKVWDHFTKAQRKNIDLWKKSLDSGGAHSSNKDKESDKSDDDVMEISDDESHDSYSTKTSVNKKARFDNDKLKEENDSLRCQLRACKSEVELLKTDNKSDSDIRDKQIKVLHETIRNLQTQLLTNKARETEVNTKISELEAKLKEANVKELLLKTKIAATSKNMRDSISSSSSKGSDCEEDIQIKPIVDISSSHDSSDDNEKPVKKLKTEHEAESADEIKPEDIKSETENCQNTSQSINLVEAKIIGLTSTFLAIHPASGARLYDIWSYVNNLLPTLKLHELHEILVRYENLFAQATTGNVKNHSDVHGEQKWKFTGFATETATAAAEKAEEAAESKSIEQ
ncbi:ecto-NOX disulfide-thiol exchanger 1 [Culicoides brevitarsis]|uniref:ecto-NOX disulfide-thiol exchanger 1 n=1 Tax=Culicoides brevitarsis TaxID=469753 RepID=UPI00307C07BA